MAKKSFLMLANSRIKVVIALNGLIWTILLLFLNYQMAKYYVKWNRVKGSRFIYEWSPSMAEENLEIILRHYPILYKYLNISTLKTETNYLGGDLRHNVSRLVANSDPVSDSYCSLLRNALKAIKLNSRLDTSRNYLIYDSYLTIPRIPTTTKFNPRGRDFKNQYRSKSPLVTLSSQVSANSLGHLPVFAESWKGPISLALLIQTQNEVLAVARFIHRLNLCMITADGIVVSLVVPYNTTTGLIEIEIGNDDICSYEDHIFNRELDCSPRALSTYYQSLITGDLSLGAKMVPTTDYLLSSMLVNTKATINSTYQDPKYRYPQNMMRNVAITAARTPYIFNVDGDLYLPPDLYSNVTKYLHAAVLRENLSKGRFKMDPRKNIFVIPAYELSNIIGHNLPHDKTELLALESKGLARVYHQITFPPAQAAPFGVAYVIKYQAFYEPFFIAPITAPLFEENFVGYGLTRNTQTLEMFMAGYTFYALNHAFCMHKNFDNVGDRPKWRQQQANKNLLKFPTLRKIMFAKYGKWIDLKPLYENFFAKHNKSLIQFWNE